MSDVTRLLDAAAAGDRRAAADLLPLVYDELRTLAAARMAAENPGHTLNATALVHEAYLRLVGDQQFDGRGHFFAAAAEDMRRILVDAARHKQAIRHGGGRRRVALHDHHRITQSPDDLLALDDALTRFASEEPAKAELVKLRFFAGLSTPDAAAALGISAESHDMAVFHIALTEDEQRVVNAERDSHPEAHVRRKMLVVWLLHCGLTRAKAAEIAGLSRPTVQRYVAAYRTGGLDGLRRWGVRGPVSDLVAHTCAIREALTDRPVRTAAEASEQIERLTGLKREPTQIRQFLKTELGFRWRRTRVIPCPPKTDLSDHIREQKYFLDTRLQPRLDEALAGGRHVFFVDAAHFVFGTFLCCLWSLTRIFVKAASGRQRFNVLGAWNAVTRELLTITNTTVVNTDTMCDLLRLVATRGWAGPVTLILDNARYQRNAVVMGLAQELGIELLFLPSYSPNLNLIERLWRFVKRKAAYGRYHPTFAEFRAAVQDVLDRVPTTHAEKLASLMTLNFQEFDDVSLLAA